MEAKPLVVIVGPTASGKTSLAIKIAQQYQGEIICADSRTVYRELNIGTAKPTNREKGSVVHWGIDIVEPDVNYTAADFKKYATNCIRGIRKRGNLPILVGGTGLYVDSVIFDYKFGRKSDPESREKFEKMTLSSLYEYCINHSIELPQNNKNKRHLIRAIEQQGINHKRNDSPMDNVIIVGLTTNKEDLRQRINTRIEQMFRDNVVNEAINLSGKYGWDVQSMSGNIYRLCRLYIDGVIDIDEAKQRAKTLDWRLAKRQMTWLRRNSYIKWMTLQDAESYLAERLASE